MTKQEIVQALQEIEDSVPNKGFWITFVTNVASIIQERVQLEEKVKHLQFEIDALEKVHEYDVRMIDEVKGTAVKLYKKIDKAVDKVIQYGEMLDTDFQKELLEILERNDDNGY